MTMDQFIMREIDLHGEDTIVDLMDRGFEPILLDVGWRWHLPVEVHAEKSA